MMYYLICAGKKKSEGEIKKGSQRWQLGGLLVSILASAACILNCCESLHC